MSDLLLDVLEKRLEFSEYNIQQHEYAVNYYKDKLKTEEDALARVMKERDEIIKQIQEEQK